MGRWGPPTGLFLLGLACGNGSAEDAPNAKPDESLSQGSVPGFVDAPVVAFRGLSTDVVAGQVAPDACVLGPQYEISDDDARDLGFDVDADYASLEKELTVDVLVSGAKGRRFESFWARSTKSA
jgi:hypothetical protein